MLTLTAPTAARPEVLTDALATYALRVIADECLWQTFDAAGLTDDHWNVLKLQARREKPRAYEYRRVVFCTFDQDGDTSLQAAVLPLTDESDGTFYAAIRRAWPTGAPVLAFDMTTGWFVHGWERAR